MTDEYDEEKYDYMPPFIRAMGRAGMLEATK